MNALYKTVRNAKVLSALGAKEQVKESLDKVDDAVALPMLFPMYTVPVLELLRMMQVRPHEELKSKGVLELFEDSMGIAAFVSHQWLSIEHPDPEGKQMRVFQDALRNMMYENTTLYPDVSQGMFLQGCRLSAEVLRSKRLFIWYDYFCVPQGKDVFQTWTFEDMTRDHEAIESIPAYIDRCEVFFVLCPVVPSVDRMELFGHTTWASRGWCLAEKLVRLLSPNPMCIIIKSAQVIETDEGPWAASPSNASPGLGTFGSNSDKNKIERVLEQVMKRLLLHCLRSKDMIRYRLYLNLYKVIFKGFRQTPAFEDVLPRPSVHTPGDIFLQQNFFKKATDVDAVGFSPLCYAALNGDPLVIRSLLEARASPNTKTQRYHRRMNTGPGITALGLCAWFGHTEGISMLLAARADVNAGLLSPICLAASANQTESINLLAMAGGLRNAISPVGIVPLGFASLHGQTDCIVELLKTPDLDLSGALLFAGMCAGNAELVFALANAKADLNEPWKPKGLLKWALRLHRLRLSLCCRGESERNTVQDLAYHCHGATPLMVAIICGRDEVSAALIAAGARLDLRNRHGHSVMDLAPKRSSDFVLRLLQGDTETKDTVIAAVSNRYPVSQTF